MTRGCALLLMCLPAFGAEPPCAANERLHSVLWMQTSAEYRASTLQAYEIAKASLPAALRDKTWTAALEQMNLPKNVYRRLPPAIIMDIDETILDNSPVQGQYIQKNTRYDAAAFNDWIERGKAAAIAGAREFVEYARSRRVTVFYVTNRGREQETATLANLASRGFAVEELAKRHVPTGLGLDNTLLMAGESAGWTGDKGIRRAKIAAYFRIVFLIGDDLNDFISGARTTPAQRAELVRPYDAYWGRKWIVVIPNPTYGSWEEALYGYDHRLTDEQVLADKRKELRTE